MGTISITCSGCGQALAASTDDPRTEVECLWCGARTPLVTRPPDPTSIRADPPPPTRPRKRQRSPSAPVEEAIAPATSTGHRQSTGTPVVSDEDNSDPYQLTSTGERPCRGCGRPLAVTAVVCPACGFDHATGERKERTYQSVHRTWETGWPLRRRLCLFLLGQAVVIPLDMLAAWTLDEGHFLITPWLFFSFMTAFLLGTYARTDLIRSEMGKVRLEQTWRLCFFKRPTRAIRRSKYEGVVSGKAPAADFWDWLAFVILLIWGFVPGVLWWYFVIRPDSYFVALTRDHGFPERNLYWGWDQQQADDMAKTLQDVAFGSI